MTVNHIEVHLIPTTRDAETLLPVLGLPRYDLEPTTCDACGATVGMCQNSNGEREWRPIGVVLNGDTVGSACAVCLNGLVRVLGK